MPGHDDGATGRSGGELSALGSKDVAPFDGMSWADSARELEQLGYSTLFVPDHFDEGYGPIAAMATAAAATEDLHVSAAVMGVDFRHPAVLAREVASIDRLSNGRLEVGLGAGYQVMDYEASGIRMDRPGRDSFAICHIL